MVSLKVSIAAAEVGRRMSERLRGGGAATSPKVVWSQNGQQLLIHTDSVASKFADGWLVVNVDVETDQTKRTTVQFVYFLGREGDGDGVGAGGGINAPTQQSSQIAAAWGADLQRVLWDAVLDGIEACLFQAGKQKPGEPLTVAGFYTAGTQMVVQVLAGTL